jgi:hypothetical protein
MKPARIDDIKQYVDIKNERTTYIYLVNGVWMLERQVKAMMIKKKNPQEEGIEL